MGTVKAPPSQGHGGGVGWRKFCELHHHPRVKDGWASVLGVVDSERSLLHLEGRGLGVGVAPGHP